MDRIIPDKIYEGLPCSMVAVGCALGLSDMGSVSALRSPALRSDGYLSLDGLNRLIRANLAVTRMEYFKRDERPALRDWAHEHIGKRAIVCVLGHYVYFDGKDYHSFFGNDGDPVVKTWLLD